MEEWKNGRMESKKGGRVKGRRMEGWKDKWMKLWKGEREKGGKLKR